MFFLVCVPAQSECLCVFWIVRFMTQVDLLLRMAIGESPGLTEDMKTLKTAQSDSCCCPLDYGHAVNYSNTFPKKGPFKLRSQSFSSRSHGEGETLSIVRPPHTAEQWAISLEMWLPALFLLPSIVSRTSQVQQRSRARFWQLTMAPCPHLVSPNRLVLRKHCRRYSQAITPLTSLGSVHCRLLHRSGTRGGVKL